MYSKTVAALCAAITLSAVTTVNAQRQSRLLEVDGTGPMSLTHRTHGPQADAPQGDGSLAGAGLCVNPVLPNNGSTSQNGRAPTTNFNFVRGHYLITAAELATAGYTSGSTPSAIGWNYSIANNGSTAPLKIYMENTADTTNIKSATWATAITGMTLVHDGSITLPATAGPVNVSFVNGSTFTYTGGGLYIAYDYGQNATAAITATILCTNTLAAGLKSAQGATAPTTLGANSPFRPETRLDGGPAQLANDVAVSYVYSMGTVKICGIPAQVIRAVVGNPGTNGQGSLPVNLTITGANSFSDTQSAPALASCGGTATVTFAAFTAAIAGANSLTVSVPADDNNANNSVSRTLNSSTTDTSYKIAGTTPAGGAGFTGGSGAFVAKFTTTTAEVISAINIEFFPPAAGTTTTYRVAVWGDSATTPGTPALAAPLYESGTDASVVGGGVAVPVTHTPATPINVPAGDFYVGVIQTNTINASYSFDNESPIRPGKFFFSSFVFPAVPTSWVDFSPATPFKLNVGYVGSACASLPVGACCTEGGGCTPNITSAACSDIEGTWNEGEACDICTGPVCPEDINSDGQINVTDLLLVISGWGSPCSDCTADINNDGSVNVTDLLAVIGQWGVCD